MGMYPVYVWGVYAVDRMMEMLFAMNIQPNSQIIAAQANIGAVPGLMMVDDRASWNVYVSSI